MHGRRKIRRKIRSKYKVNQNSRQKQGDEREIENEGAHSVRKVGSLGRAHALIASAALGREDITLSL